MSTKLTTALPIVARCLIGVYGFHVSSTVKNQVFLVVMELGVFVIGRNSIWQKVGFIQVFYNELTVTVYLGHAETSSTRFPLIFAEKKRLREMKLQIGLNIEVATVDS